MPVSFNTAATASLRENLKTIMAVSASTDGAGSISYSVNGGADAAKFTINASTGVLAFVTAPDYENPGDADTNNVYEVTIDATDGTNTASQAISVTVLDVDDALEAVEDLAAAVATDIANLTLATNALETDKADQSALDLANQAITNLENSVTALQGQVDVPGTVSEAIAEAAQQVKDDLLNGVSTEFDTFKEVADQFAQNADLIATLQNIGAGAIRFDIAQVLTASQQQRARLNMGAASEAEFQDYKANMGNPATFDPVGAYNAAKTAGGI